MNKLNKLMAELGIITSIAGGAFYTGTEANRPECDYVFITQEKQEICLTAEQAKALKEELETPIGFSGLRFGGETDNKIIKK